jgi:glycosyltransferase 2 family protein
LRPSDDDSARPRLGRARDWVLGGALLLGLVLAIGRTVGWGPLLAPWLTLDPLVLAGLVLLSALTYGLRAMRVYGWFRPRLDGQFPALLRLTILHNTANNLLPMRAGELVFPWLMVRYFGHGFLVSSAALLWIRLLDLHFLALIALGIAWLHHPGWGWLMLALVWVAGLGLLGVVGRQAESADRQSAAGRRWRRILGKGLRLLASAAPTSNLLVARTYLWTSLIWGAKFVAFATLLRHFLTVDLWQVLAGVMGAELSSVLPFHGIAGSGSYELAAVAALVPAGVAPEAALAGAVNLHLFVLGVTLVLGPLALLLPKGRQEDGEPQPRRMP